MKNGGTKEKNWLIRVAFQMYIRAGARKTIIRVPKCNSPKKTNSNNSKKKRAITP
jgi:hypothetical protein